MYVGVPGEKTGIKKDGSEISYADAVKDREKIEEQIGLSLAQNGNLPTIAAKITQNVGARSYNQLGVPARKKIDDEMDIFGGARAFKEGWGTLGASVFAVMNEIEQDGPTKTHYSTSHTENHPYFPTGEKKPEFDEPLAKLKWAELPQEVQKLLDDTKENPFKKLPPNTYDELDFKGKLTLLKGFRYKDDRKWEESKGNVPEVLEARKAINEYKKAPEDKKEEKRQAAITAAKALNQEGFSSETKAVLGFRLDVILDKHTSGDHTNLVRKDGNGGVKDQWIEDTVKAGKPIISGPSGHTLRYLNFWAEKRNEQKEAEGANSQTPKELSNWPSLEAARLVMMANLMPPRHHSYDEIMTASIGIKDEVSDALKYEHKSSYEDLRQEKHKDNKAGEIAQRAYEKSEANKVATDGAVEEEIRKSIIARKDLQQRKAALQTALNTATDETKIQDAKEVLDGTKQVTK